MICPLARNRAGVGRVLRAFVGQAAALLAPALAAAQGAPTLHISDPAAWAAGSAYAVQAGSTLRIAGVAADASGVRSVQVNGVPARLRVDPRNPAQAYFELDLVVVRELRDMVVAVQPNSGRSLQRRYHLSVVASSAVLGSPLPPDTGSARQIPELPVIKVPPPPGSPWGHYALRTVLYAGAAGAGLFLASRKTVLHDEICTGPAGHQDCVDRTQTLHNSLGKGLGIAGAAATVALIDLALTAHRAHARASTASEPPPRARTGLQPPTIEPDARGARIALLRLTF